MISRLLRRPLLVVALLLAVVGLSGAGYAVTGGDRAGSASGSGDSGRVLAAEAVEDDRAHRKAAKQTAQRERAAKLEADRVAAEKAAAEKAAAEKAAAEKAAAEKAAAERAAAEAAEAKRVAEAKRAAEQAREQAAARASREAARDPKGIARVMLGQHGWGGDQFTCLDRLWTKESEWKHTADNPTSDAYGIPQALPGSKMASAGADWRTNPATQIRWGLQYIEDVYGSPCSAWAHSQATNWY
ncbi:MAG TPA: hypothetical protein VFX33_14735 [Actinomycetales bacterium]|nr:hypothetical protein [Actinomycetales bacterium]